MAAEPRLLTTGLFAHMEQVRWTVFRLALVFVIASTCAYPFTGHLLHILVRPLGTKLVMYAPLEGLLGYVKISLTAGFCLTAPFLLYAVNRLLQSVCYASRPAALGGTVAAGGLFLVGASFCYIVIFPATLRFLLSFGGDNLAAGISVNRYLSLTLGLSVACGVIFELPLIIMVLHHLGVLPLTFLTHNRRYAILLGAVVTAILTPTPDAFTMSALLLPMLGLYEISIVLVRFTEQRARRQQRHSD